jgi:hypothetical protein
VIDENSQPAGGQLSTHKDRTDPILSKRGIVSRHLHLLQMQLHFSSKMLVIAVAPEYLPIGDRGFSWLVFLSTSRPRYSLAGRAGLKNPYIGKKLNTYVHSLKCSICAILF